MPANLFKKFMSVSALHVSGFRLKQNRVLINMSAETELVNIHDSYRQNEKQGTKRNRVKTIPLIIMPPFWN
jgi:hypothetical protein